MSHCFTLSDDQISTQHRCRTMQRKMTWSLGLYTFTSQHEYTVFISTNIDTNELISFSFLSLLNQLKPAAAIVKLAQKSLLAVSVYVNDGN